MGILAVARAYLLTALRERVTLFWFIIFPVFLLVILVLIFGNIGTQGMNFSVGLVNLGEGQGSTDFAGIVEGVFTSLGTGKKALFALHRPEGMDKQVLLAQAKKEVRSGKLAALVVIPSGFNREVIKRLATEKHGAVPIAVYTNNGVPASRLAGSIIDEVISRIDRELLIKSGHYDPGKEVKAVTTWTGKAGIAYASFLLPGIILMAFFTAGLFGVPGTILYARDQHRLRRYFVTPLTVSHYLSGVSGGELGLCLLQFVILWGIGRFGFGAQGSYARPETVIFLFLSFFTFLSFGFFIASMAKTANGAMAIANIINMPMMFLSSLFFPVGNLPTALKAIVLVNPLTYLAAGLRTSLGLGGETISPVISVGIPIVWIGVCAWVAAKRLSWEAR